jgi:hypothetical protein
MSIERRCPNCFQQENMRVNFGNNREAEKDFHSQKWCSCGYNSPIEMMADQDMGFSDPQWIPIANHFIENYHLRISQGHIHNNEELVRFFLKLLKTSANNIIKSIEIVEKKQGEEYEFIYKGKATKAPKTNIFNESLISNLNFPQQPDKQESNAKNPKSKFINIVLYIIIGIAFGLLAGKIL